MLQPNQLHRFNETQSISVKITMGSFRKREWQWQRREAIKKSYNGILVPVRTSFGLRWRGGKTYNVST